MDKIKLKRALKTILEPRYRIIFTASAGLAFVLVVHVFLVDHSQRGEEVSHEERHVRAAAHRHLHHGGKDEYV